MSNNNKQWRAESNNFFPTDSTSLCSKLDPGIYSYASSPSMGWWLAKDAERFLFGYKIYGSHNHIINRISKAWAAADSNLGVLFNGLKGTGKTITTQLLCNWAVDQGIPVLVVSDFIKNITEIIASTNQDMMIVFDEFEKTHQKTELQQTLLTALDGMARNQFRRLFLFTTNTPALEANFVDRPSRIRYTWEFTDLSEQVMEELFNDLLDPSLADLKLGAIQYLETRTVCSFDVVKTVINELNLMRDIDSLGQLNLSQKIPLYYDIYLVDKNGSRGDRIFDLFKPESHYATALRDMLTRSGARRWVADYIPGKTFRVSGQLNSCCLTLIEPVNDQPYIWKANLQVLANHTWLSKYMQNVDLYQERRWIDVPPEDWRTPKWALTKERTEEEAEQMEKYDDSGTIYGGQMAELLIELVPVYTMNVTYSKPSENAM